VIYVGGGGNLDPAGSAIAHPHAGLYALDALTGSILWDTALGDAPSHFSWTSPAVYHDSVYMGVSSYDDCPLIQGQLVKLDARTGAIQQAFHVVPTGCEGGSVWGSPVVDEKRGDIYFATGNARICSVLGPQWGRYPHTKKGMLALLLGLAGSGLALISWRRAFGPLLIGLGVGVAVIGVTTGTLFLVGPTLSITRPYAISIVKVAANDLHVEGYWHIPASENTDYDFGTTPTLFRGTVTAGGRPRDLLGAVNKNGFYYVFDRSDLNAGPLVRIRIAYSRITDPTQGNGSISPSAYDGQNVYVAGGMAQIGGISSKGSVVALNPNDLQKPIWQQPLSGPVLGAVTAVPGLLVVGAGSSTVVLTAVDGAPVFTTPVSSAGKPAPAVIYGAATVANGVLYQGDTYGYLYALSVDGG
jgi:outer membrane protein assembly factor BamB